MLPTGLKSISEDELKFEDHHIGLGAFGFVRRAKWNDNVDVAVKYVSKTNHDTFANEVVPFILLIAQLLCSIVVLFKSVMIRLLTTT